MMTFPEIRTEYSLLKHISNDSIPILKGIFEDDNTRKYLPELYSLIDTNDGILQFITTFDIYTEKEDGFLWGIHCDNLLVGFVAVMDLSYNPILFYATHPGHRSRGYMKDAISVVVDYLRKNILCNIISTDVYKDNYISIHLLEQLGFNVDKEDNNKVYLSKVFR